MRKARSASILALGAYLILITTMCSPSKKPVKEAAKETVKEAVDTSTVDDWESHEERHFEVAMYAENVGMTTSFHMIFDFRDTNRLGLPPVEVVQLLTPSEAFQPGTFTFQGSLGVILEKNENGESESITYGKYQFESVGVGSEERIAAIFRRSDDGEMGFGSVGGNIWRTHGKSKEIIGKVSMRELETPEGEKRKEIMVRWDGENQKWTTDLGGKIYQQEPDGKLVQIGWVSWRKFTTSEGKKLGILMTKSMSPTAKWEGRFGGRHYRDQ